MLRSPVPWRAFSACLGRSSVPAMYAHSVARRTAVTYDPVTKQRIYSSNSPPIMPEICEANNLHDWMVEKISVHPSTGEALISADDGRIITFGELPQHFTQYAGILYHKGGVRKGDVVLLCSLNSVEYPMVVYGVLELGAIISTVNPVSTPDMLAGQIEASGAKVVVAQGIFKHTAHEAAKLVKQETGLELRVLLVEEDFSNSSGCMLPEGHSGTRGSDPNDTIFLPFSSGTTGKPKGVQLTNRNIISNILQSSRSFPFVNSDVSVSVLPFFHIYGFTCVLNTMLLSGIKQVVVSRYEVRNFAGIIEKYKVTAGMIVPPVAISLLKYMETSSCNLSSLRTLNSGAAPMGKELQVALEKDLMKGGRLTQGYGLTETSPVVTATNGKITDYHGSAGCLLSDTELRVVKVSEEQQSGDDFSAGVDAEEGEEGEIWVRGPQVMKGYLNAEDTAKVMVDKWFRTGDIGRMDPKTEFLYITDRLKELIKYKGFQVSPAELESIVLMHPLVADAIVIGVPDEKKLSFEVARALVVLKKTVTPEEAAEAPKKIISYVASRVPLYKHLHGGVRIVESVPKTATGKLLRRQARHDESEYVMKEKSK